MELKEDIEALRQLDPPALAAVHHRPVRGGVSGRRPRLVEAARDRLPHYVPPPHAHLEAAAPRGGDPQVGRDPRVPQRGEVPAFARPLFGGRRSRATGAGSAGVPLQSSAWDSDEQARSTGELPESPIAGAGRPTTTSSKETSQRRRGPEVADQIHAERSLLLVTPWWSCDPHDIARHAGVLRQFIEDVGRVPKDWGCFRDWLAEAGPEPPLPPGVVG